MQEIENDLRASLRHNVPAGYPLAPTTDVVRGVRMRRIRMVAAPSLSLILLGFVGTWSWDLVFDSATRKPKSSSIEPASPDATVATPTQNEMPSPTSEIYKLASGQENGKSWSLLTRSATSDNGRSLCLDFTFDGSSTGFDCFLGWLSGPSGSHDVDLVRFTGSRHTAILGVATERVAAVELKLDNGSTTAGEVYSAPKSLKADIKFFVVFAPEDEDNKLIARSSSGEILQESRTD